MRKFQNNQKSFLNYLPSYPLIIEITPRLLQNCRSFTQDSPDHFLNIKYTSRKNNCIDFKIYSL